MGQNQFAQKEQTIVGIGALKQWILYLQQQIELPFGETGMKIGTRNTRVLMEHKWGLTELVRQFVSERAQKQLLVYAEENEKLAKMVHMLGIKANLRQSRDIVLRIIKSMERIYENEKKYIPILSFEKASAVFQTSIQPFFFFRLRKISIILFLSLVKSYTASE